MTLFKLRKPFKNRTPQTVAANEKINVTGQEKRQNICEAPIIEVVIEREGRKMGKNE